MLNVIVVHFFICGANAMNSSVGEVMSQDQALLSPDDRGV